MNSETDKNITKMYPKLMKVTPELAQKWLSHNTENRRIKTDHVEWYSRQMISGEFILSHQGVAFTGTPKNPGVLIDAQHRLMAIVKSGVTVWLWVFFECDISVKAVTDGGISRTFQDHYGVEGWNRNRISFANYITRLVNFPRIVKMTKVDADEIYSAFGEPFERLMKGCGATRKGVSTAPVKLAAVITAIRNPQHEEAIFGCYRDMVLENLKNLPTSCTRLFVKLTTNSFPKGQAGGFASLTMALKCFDPASWHLTKIYVDDDMIKDKISPWVKAYIQASAERISGGDSSAAH